MILGVERQMTKLWHALDILRADHEREKEGATVRISELSAEVGSLRGQVEGLQAANKGLQKELKTVNGELAQRSEEIKKVNSRLEAAVSKSDNWVEGWQQEQSKIQRAMAAAKKRLHKVEVAVSVQHDAAERGGGGQSRGEGRESEEVSIPLLGEVSDNGGSDNASRDRDVKGGLNPNLAGSSGSGGIKEVEGVDGEEAGGEGKGAVDPTKDRPSYLEKLTAGKRKGGVIAQLKRSAPLVEVREGPSNLATFIGIPEVAAGRSFVWQVQQIRYFLRRVRASLPAGVTLRRVGQWQEGKSRKVEVFFRNEAERDGYLRRHRQRLGQGSGVTALEGRTRVVQQQRPPLREREEEVWDAYGDWGPPWGEV